MGGSLSKGHQRNNVKKNPRTPRTRHTVSPVIDLLFGPQGKTPNWIWTPYTIGCRFSGPTGGREGSGLLNCSVHQQHHGSHHHWQVLKTKWERNMGGPMQSSHSWVPLFGARLKQSEKGLAQGRLYILLSVGGRLP